MPHAIRARAISLIALSLALGGAGASAAQLRLPPVLSAGKVLRAEARVWLVGPGGSRPEDQALAFVSSDLATEGRSVQITDPAGAVLTLPSQPELATAGGQPTYYRICYYLPPAGRERCHPLVQLADTPDVQELADIVGAEAIAPGSIRATRLPPDPSDAPDGQAVVVDDGRYVLTSVTPGSGIGDAPTDGAQYCRESGAWAECEGGAVTLAGTPDYLTLSGQQITIGLIDLAADVTGALPYASLSGAPTSWAWSAITGTPTTLAGYGITDAATATQGSQGASAYAWGDHASAGYALADDVADRLLPVSCDADQVAAWSGSAWSCADPATGGAGGANLSAGYTTTTVTVASDSGTDATIAAAVAGTSAGVMSAAQAAALATALQSESDPDALAAIDDLNAADVGADPAGTGATAAAAAVSAHVTAPDPHPGYLLESAAGDAALLDVGTTAGTVAAGTDSRLSDARAPTVHAASHGDGGSDEISLDGSQITAGSVPTARAPAGTYLEWIEVPLTPVGGTLTASDLIVADVPYAGTITAARVACQTAPSVSAASIDLRRNASWGSTPTTVLSAAISLGAGVFEASGTIASATLTAGDVLAGYVANADGGATAKDCILTVSITRSAP